MSPTALPKTSVMDSEGPTGKLINWVNTLSLDDVPEEIRTRAKYLILDGVGCALVGAHLPWSEKAARCIFAMESPGSCTIFGWDRKIGPLPAAILNSTFIQGFELDDWHSGAPLHSNSIILPALFAAAEQVSTTSAPTAGTDLLLATIAGYEAGPRVGLALYGTQMLTRGWHSGAVFGPAASSLAVSKMLSMSAAATEDALGTACTQACGLMSAQFESEAKRMQHGFAARNGLFAALLAREGYIGIKKVLERSYGGFLPMFGQGSGMNPAWKEEEIYKGLGDIWQIENICVKPYSSMAGTHPTVDCIRALQQREPEAMRDFKGIKKITIEMGDAAFKHGGFEIDRPTTATGGQMSNKYVLATQMVDGQVLPAQFRHDKLDRDEVWDLVQKTECFPSKTFQSISEQKVTIEFDDDKRKTLQQTVKAARGVSPALSNKEIVEKWRTMTESIIDSKRREAIEKMILGIEDVTDVRELVQLLAGETKNPIA